MDILATYNSDVIQAFIHNCVKNAMVGKECDSIYIEWFHFFFLYNINLKTNIFTRTLPDRIILIYDALCKKGIRTYSNGKAPDHPVYPHNMIWELPCNRYINETLLYRKANSEALRSEKTRMQADLELN